uniref:Secreted protein n=1 Tax=Macrostomum lignano TaxID=282301 RepID=A0A1I8GKB7_9PLAT
IVTPLVKAASTMQRIQTSRWSTTWAAWPIVTRAGSCAQLAATSISACRTGRNATAAIRSVATGWLWAPELARRGAAEMPALPVAETSRTRCSPPGWRTGTTAPPRLWAASSTSPTIRTSPPGCTTWARPPPGSPAGAAAGRSVGATSPCRPRSGAPAATPSVGTAEPTATAACPALATPSAPAEATSAMRSSAPDCEQAGAAQ